MGEEASIREVEQPASAREGSQNTCPSQISGAQAGAGTQCVGAAAERTSLARSQALGLFGWT